ncbi:MAG TPA: hypothetical protein VF283_07540 [Bryobacteraceae bacterium]
MKLGSHIVVNKNKEEVWSFLADPQNISKWDRGVRAVEPGTSTVLPGEGFEFTTIGHDASAPDHGRMAYRVGQTDPDAGCRVDLVNRDGNARYFKSAYWSFRVIGQSGIGSDNRARIECLVDFSLRARYLWLAPILYFMRRAIYRDLIGLKRVLECA